MAGYRSHRDVRQAMVRGFRKRCPSCEAGTLYGKFLKVTDHCPNCNEALHHHKADDAPAYFTILIVAHVVIGLVLFSEKYYEPPYLLHMLVWPALTVGLSLFLLPRIKGALVGLQWANRMHGFDPDAPDEDEVARDVPLR